jgi:hypothetical protein
VWHGQNRGVPELTYLIPMASCRAIVRIWQRRHATSLTGATLLKSSANLESGDELDLLMSSIDGNMQSTKNGGLLTSRDKPDPTTFLNGIKEWQASQRRMDGY